MARTSTREPVKLADVDPLSALIESQRVPPDASVTRTRQVKVPDPVFRIEKDCGGTTPPPWTPIKVRPTGETTRRCGAGFTVMVTGTVTRMSGAPVSTICPRYVHAPSDAGVARTLRRTPGVNALEVPKAVVTLSQLPPLFVAALAVRLTDPLPWFVTVNVCVEAAPPCVKENVRDSG